jgi:predicted AAA+ superfamily ATPase
MYIDLMQRLYFAQVQEALRRSRIVVLTGPRQCGKTTLAREFVSEDSLNYFDLEDPRSAARLAEPMSVLELLNGLVVIDEIQRMPQLFPILRVLADRKNARCRFLILGSVSPELMRNVSESLAGRTEAIELTPFTAAEVPTNSWQQLWLRGGFPRSFLAKTDHDSFVWRSNYVETFLRRDLQLMGFNLSVEAIRRFWFMLSHWHGNIWNAAEPARSLGVNETTVRRYLDILTGLFLVRQLKPWHENLTKRQVKAPKIYFRDSGLLHYMLGIHNMRELSLHVKFGASWEGFILEQLIWQHRQSQVFYWATHAGAELDLLVMHRNRRIGYEIKRADAPTLTPSMKVAFKDLRLDALFVVYPGRQAYPLAPGIQTLPAEQVLRNQKVLPQKTARKIKPTRIR